MAEKIKITKISDKARTHKGFGDGAFSGCFNCPCGVDKKGGACCRYGCDVDKESFELMKDNRTVIEEKVEKKLEDCITGKWSKGNYLGGAGTESLTRDEDGYCVFHKQGQRGCWLVELVMKKGLPKRLVPTICRLYPLTWTDDGELVMTDEDDGDPIETGCDCTRIENRTTKTIMETQKEELDDVFEIDA